MKRLLTTALLLGSAACFAQVKIEGDVFVSSGEEVHIFESVINDNAGDFTVAEQGLLYVDGTLVNNGSMTFNNAASLMRGNTNSDGTGSGTYYVKRQGSTSGSIYNYWSSPMVSYSGVPGSNTYRYESSQGTQTYSDDQPSDPGWEAHAGAMTPGSGYAGRGAGLHTFVGDVNNGNVNMPLFHTADIPGNTAAGTPFNLVGNPYPSAISCLDLVTANPDIGGAIYLWDDDQSGGTGYSYTDYAVWNGTGSLGTGAGTSPPNGFISTGQGFKVKSISGGSVLNFTNSMRRAGNNTQFFRTAQENDSRMWLSLSNETEFNHTLFAVLADATDGIDRLYDADKLRGNQNIAIASMYGEHEYAIQAVGEGIADKIIPLVTYVSEAGIYVIKADSIEGFSDYPVFLHDNNTGQSFPLFQGAEYSFQIALEDEYGRFQLGIHFSALSAPTETEIEPTLYTYGQNLVIRSPRTSKNSIITLMDMSGRVIWRSTQLLNVGETSILLPSVSSGSYIISAIINDKRHVLKTVL